MSREQGRGVSLLQLRQMLDALERIHEVHIEDAADRDLTAGYLTDPHRPLPAMMDRYDLRGKGQGSGWNRRSVSYPSVWVRGDVDQAIGNAFTGWWRGTCGISLAGPSPQARGASALPSAEEIAEEAERREYEQKIAEFQGRITAAGKAPAMALEDPAPKPTVEESPDYIGTITGWRGWRVSREGRLIGVGKSLSWTPRKRVPAVCQNGGWKNWNWMGWMGNTVPVDHNAPHKDCYCGYWAFRSVDVMKEALREYVNEDVDVVGTVELWGRVIECENGWRAEYAYPKELWLLQGGLEQLSWIYGVPVRQVSE